MKNNASISNTEKLMHEGHDETSSSSVDSVETSSIIMAENVKEVML